MSGVGQYFLLAFTALLPLGNPFGSALVFLGMVGEEPDAVYRQLAGRVAAGTFVFLLSIEYLGSVILGFFGIALPIVQVAGGLVIARRPGLSCSRRTRTRTRGTSSRRPEVTRLVRPVPKGRTCPAASSTRSPFPLPPDPAA